MTLPRVLSLVDTPLGGPRLAGAPVSDRLFGEPVPVSGSLPGEVYKLTVSGEGEAEISLSNSLGEAFLFGVDSTGDIYIDRSNSGARDFDPEFAKPEYGRISAPRFFDGPWTLELTFDRSICELFGDRGTRAFTQLLYPTEPYTSIDIKGNARAGISLIK